MAAKLSKPVRRMAELDRMDVIVTLYPGGTLGFRQKRCRKEYCLPVMTVYRFAIEADQARQKAERRKARGQKVLVKRGLL